MIDRLDDFYSLRRGVKVALDSKDHFLQMTSGEEGKACFVFNLQIFLDFLSTKYYKIFSRRKVR